MAPRILFGLILIGLSPGRADEVSSLMDKLKRVAEPEAGISKAEEEVASEIWKIGAAAIPSLLELLKHKDRAVRALAGYTLRDIEGLTPEHFEALVAGYRNDGGWLPPAIARTGHPQALRFLIEEYFRKRESYTQLDWAIGLFGEKAAESIITGMRKEKHCDEDFLRCVRRIFEELGMKARGSIPALAELAQDQGAGEGNRAAALTALATFGHGAAEAAPVISRLRQSDSKQVREAAEYALIATGDAEGIELLLSSFLREMSSGRFAARGVIAHRFMGDFAAHGESARIVGPRIAEYLKDEDWEARWVAARTLGFIGYDGAVESLIEALRSPEDWRLVWAAAGSLGRLRAVAARSALELVAAEHWFKPVRDAADTALRALAGADPYQKAEQDEPDDIRDSEPLDDSDFERIRMPKRKDDNRASLEWGKKRELFLGIRVSDGLLLGSDQGEWGGRLVYVDRQKRMRVLADVNTGAIYGGDTGAIALTGLAHMTTNYGLAYKVERDANGNWAARPWRALPGAPRFVRPLQDGGVLAVCWSGSVILSPDGTLKQVSRKELLGN